MNKYAGACHFRVELAYARIDNLLFGERIYRSDAALYLHRDLADVVRAAARHCFEAHNLRFVLYDGLRTYEAQERMMETRRVKDNPNWLEEPRLLSPPGSGGHPRGMAIDIGLETLEGKLLDMGTPFDYLAENPAPEHNPAHRLYQNHPDEVYRNRAILDEAIAFGSTGLGVPIFPLPQEWWDYRLPVDVFSQYAPLHEGDLYDDMKLLDV
ncbi:MAG: D-alanyl-D-alanine carboxypeptidase family protein [Alphaproteobacteria bacterium]|nr:D-alanyl-D-alanine carboxypeptidase family protein [Alphaproteobacteria bacterium]